MSDTNLCPYDSVLATLRKRQSDLFEQRMKIDERLAECFDMINLVESKRPKAPRKSRVIVEAAPESEDTSPRPTVFATHSLGEAEAL